MKKGERERDQMFFVEDIIVSFFFFFFLQEFSRERKNNAKFGFWLKDKNDDSALKKKASRAGMKASKGSGYSATSCRNQAS